MISPTFIYYTSHVFYLQVSVFFFFVMNLRICRGGLFRGLCPWGKFTVSNFEYFRRPEVRSSFLGLEICIADSVRQILHPNTEANMIPFTGSEETDIPHGVIL